MLLGIVVVVVFAAFVVAVVGSFQAPALGHGDERMAENGAPPCLARVYLVRPALDTRSVIESRVYLDVAFAKPSQSAPSTFLPTTGSLSLSASASSARAGTVRES